MLSVMLALVMSAPAPKYKPLEFQPGIYDNTWGIGGHKYTYEFYANGKFLAYSSKISVYDEIYLNWSGNWTWDKDKCKLIIKEFSSKRHTTQPYSTNPDGSVGWEITLDRKLSGVISSSAYHGVRLTFKKVK